MKNIYILTTGGTIEKTYDEFDGQLQNRETIIKNRIVSKLRLPYTNIEVKSIMAKDSLNMDQQDRIIIFQAIQRFAKLGHPIVVLHGTDTMQFTAEFCFNSVEKPSVPVIFTGAMKPLGFEDSDALQNVVEALYAANMMLPGWYISFHNRLFKVPTAKKNKQRGTFEEI